MSRQTWKAGNMLYPLPAVLVSVADRAGRSNVFTVAWTGTICSDPPMVSISVRPERYSYHMIEETGEYVINLTTESLAYATDYCGVKSGRDVDKWKEMGLTQIRGGHVQAPMVAESPVNIECRVTQKLELGSHHMFLAEVLAVHVDEQYMDETGRFLLNDAKPLVYSHGRYLVVGKEIGSFGYSVKKGKTKQKHRNSMADRDNRRR
ncbi:MAG: flavin reductase family protein [Lachnospiraceae bacterium]|nr:flavin reductase family protein [Lachnospiraceae bacterium]